MVVLTSEAQRQQDSIGQDAKALTEAQLRARTLNLLTVSGGYISTDRDEMGNILLYEDPNNLGSNKQLVNQYISIDVERRDYDDDEIQKVYDTDITELLKIPKTKTADELRAEIERMRQLLADAEADIIVEEVVFEEEKRPGIEIIQSGEQEAPFTIDVDGTTLADTFVDILSDVEETYEINVQTAIWDTDNQRIIPDQLNVPKQMVKYEVSLDIIAKELFVKLTSMNANPEQFQGWYLDAENLGNTQNYISIGNQENIVTINLTGTRNANQGPENEFTLAVAFKDEAPPLPDTFTLTVQLESTGFHLK